MPKGFQMDGIHLHHPQRGYSILNIYVSSLVLDSAPKSEPPLFLLATWKILVLLSCNSNVTPTRKLRCRTFVMLAFLA